MTKFTKTQESLLRRAAEAGADGVVTGPKEAMTIAALTARGFLTSQPIPEGGRAGVITDAGRAAIGAPPEPAPPLEDAASASPAEVATPKGKIGALVALLQRPEGATVKVMMTATGWQAHSVRGAMSGSVKKALGLHITSEKVDGVRTYRVTRGVAA